MGFAESLKRERERKCMTQEQLAKKLEISQALISQYENGSTSPTVALAVKIAKVLNTTCEEMVAR